MDTIQKDSENKRAQASIRMNWLRAAVLGANDGIISVAALLVGVAGATDDNGVILTTGIAGLVAGALSMAVGEYVSVSSQRDGEKALLEKERRELAEYPEREEAELARFYEAKGLSPETAQRVAHELSARDALLAHADAELAIDSGNLTNPTHAAIASALAFSAGALLPIIAIISAPLGYTVPMTFVAVLLGLIITGISSAHIGGADKLRATLRVVIGGGIAMAITFGIGSLMGTTL